MANKGRCWSDASISQELLGIPEAKRKAWNRFSTINFRENNPADTLTFYFSKMFKEYISVVL